MKDYIEIRAKELAQYIVAENATVRVAAKHFGVSKSTVHKDVGIRLYDIDRQLYLRVKMVLGINKSERHIRGGMATREKYKRQNEFVPNLPKKCCIDDCPVV